MNFQELMTVAEHKQENISKTKNVSRYSLDLPAPKKELKPKPKSKIVQSLIEEKKREKEAAEKAERERKEEERKKNQFRIPKKKPNSTIDKDSLINSLFDDSGVQSGDSSSENAKLHKHSKDKTSESLPSSHKDRHSSHHSDSHSGHGTSPSSDNRHQDKSSKERSSRKHEKYKSSCSSTQKDSSQSNHLTSSKSTTENHKSGSLSSDKKPSKSLVTKSSQQQTHSTSSSNKSPGDKPKAPSDGQPVVLTKHHLNPTIERQASEMSEREKILAKLAAIKQRTLEALHKENASKGKRIKGDKSNRKSKGEEKLEDKAKSVEIIRGEISSGEEDGDRNDVPSALDVMLSDRNAKLEKDKISRLAKQAWERATKKSSDTEDKVKKNSKSSGKESNSKKHHKHKSSDRDQRKAHSLSPSTTRSNKPLIKPKKFKSSQPPPLDFKAILAMAEQKQKEPPKPVGPLPKKKKEEDERPLTQEEKDRRERKKSKAYQEWLQKGGQRPDQRDANGRDTLPPSSSSSTQMTKIKPSKPLATSYDKHNHMSKQSENGISKAKSMTVNENVLVCGPGEYSEDDEESPQVRQQQEGSNPFDKIMQQFHKKRSGAQISSDIPSKRRILDSEEEESDDDSFIDDGDDGELDYSKEIQKLFGYNKNKYKDEDDDDLAGMEASFSTVMAEEKRSAKLGLLEDLEDMRREEEELKRKALMKKQMKKGK